VPFYLSGRLSIFLKKIAKIVKGRKIKEIPEKEAV
jgi:hypothetical protein